MSDKRGSENEPRFLVIGQITKPHGVRGEVRVFPHTDLPERFSWLDVVYIGDAHPQAVGIRKVRLQKGMVILKLSGYDSRDDAELLRGKLVQIEESQAIPLAEHEYFLYQLLNLSVETENGVSLGRLIEVIETGANNVFVVQGDESDILIPDIPEVVVDIDFDQKRMIVNPLPGLLNA